MAKTVQKITLSASRDIPFNQLVLSQANVRRIKAGVSIEELALDIARRSLLQSLTVRPVLDADGAETGMFEIPAGGRRFRALELLVKQKRLGRTAPIPCVVRTEGTAEEDSLAENVQRAPLHPLDQFRAFLTLREKGLSEEEIAAAFFVAVTVVKQRLRLAAVLPKLLDVYAEDGMTLDQLMAFTVSPDHERQEQVWEAIQRSYNKEPYQIRRLLTEGAVRSSDKRAQYAGAAYAAAGGAVMRDLFQPDEGGWLQDAGLLQRVACETLEHDATVIRAEGWKWVEVAIDFPYGHTYGLRLIAGEQPPLTEAEGAKIEALRAEAEQLEEAHANQDELPEAVERRLNEIETALIAIEARPVIYDAADIARAGAFVSIDGSGRLRVERGYVRAEDEPPVAEPELSDPDGDSFSSGDTRQEADDDEGAGSQHGPHSDAAHAAPRGDGATSQLEAPEEDEGIRPIPDRLLTELTAYRTLALRDVLGADPATAFLALLHVLCLKLFYRYGSDSCLEIEPKSVMFGNHAPGLTDTPLAARVDARHRSWAEQLPEDAGTLWDALLAFDTDSREALFAHCVSLTINAVNEAWSRRPKAIAHADRLADAVSLDMVATGGWEPTVDNFLGRVTKARILEAVREVRGDALAQSIDHLKKGEMAVRAEELLAGTGWLPEPLRAPGWQMPAMIVEQITETTEVIATTTMAVEPSSVGDMETSVDPVEIGSDTVMIPADDHVIAAE
ncbi:ParB/RepB/Spo0J family partition protein [Acidiphilium iwatense]|uniref:ParB/RepB/Spo0J family partition protein n=1 Tax=Acidiphilium iwatense TaxID=768198 RepID=A0ABS9DYI4_9PROT|nr:ParB/RepB/Spo0J family partition protein [Acidiphilium iwatense]MCF3947805.1 ParB/RepB/Spo0J family partition protein [Acidiphilium iwatense]